MANTRNANTYYVDATGTLPVNKNIRLCGVLVTPSASPGFIALKDSVTLATKGIFSSALSGQSIYFYLYDSPIVFPNGITVATLTDCAATLILEEGRT